MHLENVKILCPIGKQFLIGKIQSLNCLETELKEYYQSTSLASFVAPQSIQTEWESKSLRIDSEDYEFSSNENEWIKFVRKESKNNNGKCRN